MSSQDLVIRISAQAKQFQDELKKVETKTKALQDNLATAAKVSGAAFVALTGVIAGTVQRAGAFEKTFTNVVTLLDKSSFSTKTLDKGIEDLKKGVIALSIESGESFDVLNKGLFDLISAGVPAEKAIDTLRASTELATAGATDTATATKALTAAITAYGESAGSADEIAQKFFTAQKFGVTTVGELAQEFNKIAGLSKTMGISFDEALASATALTSNGAKPTAQAFTEMKAVLNAVILAQSKLNTQSPEVQAALSLENIKRVGLNQALAETMKATGGNVVAIQKLLGSSEALSAVLSLTGAQAGTFKTILGGMNDEQSRAANFADALKTKQETLDKATARLKQSFDAAAVVIGETFVPLIVKGAEIVGGFAKRFSELDRDTLGTISTFIKFAAVLTGLSTAFFTGALGLLKFKNFMTALNLAFGVGRVKAALFWGAATLGIATMISFLPEIIGYVKELVGWFSKLGDDPKGLKNINSELERMKKLRDDVANDNAAVNFGDKKDEQLAKIDAEIAKLEQLKQKELEVKAVQAGESAPGAPAAAVKEEAPVANNEALKIKDEETKKRIALAEMEADKLKAIRDNVSKEEIDFEARKAENKLAAIEANKIMDEEERALALENLQLKNEQLLMEEQEYQIRRAEEIALAREQQAVLDEELQALDEEARLALREKDLEELRTQIKTEDQIKNEAAKKRLQDKIKERNQFLKDEQQHGAAYANIQRVLNSEQMQMAGQAANALVGMQQSKNNTLKSIGKAAAMTQLGMETATTAMSAYGALAPIPFVGPVLGAAAAAAVIAYGAERASNIMSANKGGLIPNTSSSVAGKDSIPATLTPGELVVPAQNFEEVVEATAAARSGGGTSEEGGGILTIEMQDRVGEFISLNQRQGRALGIIGARA